MNIHHLELFYYVARHGGISEAVRNMPYGIQQPAVSAQVIQLEESIGTTLFHRRPFSLTPSGQRLYEFIEPFFSRVDRVAEELRGGVGQTISIGASEIVLRDHLPAILNQVRESFPGLKLGLRQGYHAELLGLLERREVDIAITLLEQKPPMGVSVASLMEIPLVLLVPRKSRIQSAEELWKRDKIEEPLVCLPPTEVVTRQFQQGLASLGVDWFPSITVSSVELIQIYVANGYGIGLGIDTPDAIRPKEIRLVPLPGFQPLTMAVYWQGRRTPLVESLLAAVRSRAQLLSTPGAA